MSDASEYENCTFHSLESDGEVIYRGPTFDEVINNVSQRFQHVPGLSSFYLYPDGKKHYVASVLFKTNKDVKRFQQSAAARDIVAFVYGELERGGFGTKGDITVRFYFDSSEEIDARRAHPNIPSDEDIARAEAADREDFRNLDKVCEATQRYFERICPLHQIHILPQEDVTFRAYVFFDEDKDIERCKRSGIVRDLIDFVYAELERAGRGKKGDITVAFEFDSDENVTVNYEGDYFLRLR